MSNEGARHLDGGISALPAKKLAESTMAARLRSLVSGSMGDDLERATMAFGGLSEKQLDQQYGQSGKTCREIWDDYKRRREDDKALRAFTETLLASRGL